MSLNLLEADTILSNFSSSFALGELKVPNSIRTKMALIGCMRYHSFLRYSKHTIILEKDITTLATTLFMLEKHQHNSFSQVQTVRIPNDC
jgi:hypothetical protein